MFFTSNTVSTRIEGVAIINVVCLLSVHGLKICVDWRRVFTWMGANSNGLLYSTAFLVGASVVYEGVSLLPMKYIGEGE
jgi:hypothetical protein